MSSYKSLNQTGCLCSNFLACQRLYILFQRDFLRMSWEVDDEVEIVHDDIPTDPYWTPLPQKPIIESCLCVWMHLHVLFLSDVVLGNIVCNFPSRLTCLCVSSGNPSTHITCSSQQCALVIPIKGNPSQVVK
jgi:hypothetical protein